MLTRRRLIAAKIEAAEGTPELLSNTEAGIVAIDPKWDLDLKMYDRSNVMLNTLSPIAPVAGQRMGKISFSAELKGAGATYSATVQPAIGKYLRACGFAETIGLTVGSESVTYLPASTGVPSLTIAMYDDGMVKRISGARGTVKFSGKIGEAIIAAFEFQGIYDTIATASMLTPALEATVPPILLGNALTIGGSAIISESIDIDMGNNIFMRPDINSATGYKSAIITSRKPTAKFDAEAIANTTVYDALMAGTQQALNLGPVAAVSGTFNKYTITAPKLVATKVADGDRSGIATNSVDYTLCMNTGDDEISIVFGK